MGNCMFVTTDIKREIPVIPPSIKPLESKKLFKPNAALTIPARISKALMISRLSKRFKMRKALAFSSGVFGMCVFGLKLQDCLFLFICFVT